MLSDSLPHKAATIEPRTAAQASVPENSDVSGKSNPKGPTFTITAVVSDCAFAAFTVQTVHSECIYIEPLKIVCSPRWGDDCQDI